MIYEFFVNALLAIFWLTLYAAGWVAVMLVVGYGIKAVIHILSTFKRWHL